MNGQRILGAILAGGEARRFGSDKALALFDGQALIDHVAAALRAQCSAVIVVGREHGGLSRVSDRPRAGLGPLGALAGALHWARREGFPAVLSAPCDAPILPPDLPGLLGSGPSYLSGLPVVGLWPTALAEHLDRWLADDHPRAVRHWAAAVGARAVVTEVTPPNVNTPEDLRAIHR